MNIVEIICLWPLIVAFALIFYAYKNDDLI